MGCVELDAVEPGLARPPGAIGESLDRVIDFPLAHRLRQNSIQGFRAAGGAPRDSMLVRYAGQIQLPARMAELKDVAAIVLVDLFSNLSPERNAVVVTDRRVTGQDSTANGDGGV